MPDPDFGNIEIKITIFETVKLLLDNGLDLYVFQSLLAEMNEVLCYCKSQFYLNEIYCPLICRKTVYNSLKRMVYKKILLKVGKKYYINVVGIVALLETDRLNSKLAREAQWFEFFLKELGFTEDDFEIDCNKLCKESQVKLNEVLIQKMEEIKRRRAVIQADKVHREMRIKDIQPWIESVCVDVGLIYLEIEWTSKEFGQAKNWLNECRNQEINPWVFLRSSIKIWGRFADNNISFSEFYKKRKKYLKEIQKIEEEFSEKRNQGKRNTIMLSLGA